MTAHPITFTPTATAPRVRLLGPLEVTGCSPPTAAKRRATLAMLAVHAGSYLSFDELSRELWEHRPIGNPKQSVITYVTHLRRRHGLPVESRPGGYVLRVPALEVDVLRYLSFVDRARREAAQGSLLAAEDTLRAARSLWRGGFLEDVTCGPVLSGWRLLVEECRREATLLGFDIDLRAGRVRDAAVGLRVEWLRDRCREDTAARLMVALYTLGRQVDALNVHRDTATALREEYGLDPGVGLQRLQGQILAGDPALELEAT